MLSFFFFFNDTATTEIYTLSLHDALPILQQPGGGALADGDAAGDGDDVGHLGGGVAEEAVLRGPQPLAGGDVQGEDRKSTRLNSSHANISYAVFCLKKKKKSK